MKVMEHWIPFIEEFQGEFIIGLIAAVVVLLLLLFFTMINLSLFRSKYNKLNKGTKGISFDEHILNNKKEIEYLKNAHQDAIYKINDLQNKFQGTYSKSVLHKYDAFENQGGKLSFVLVMLNQHNDGFILHNIHNNDFSYLYAKNIKDGQTLETLTSEEQKAITLAMNN
jgi:hypothetical protein